MGESRDPTEGEASSATVCDLRYAGRRRNVGAPAKKAGFLKLLAEEFERTVNLLWNSHKTKRRRGSMTCC